MFALSVVADRNIRFQILFKTELSWHLITYSQHRRVCMCRLAFFPSPFLQNSHPPPHPSIISYSFPLSSTSTNFPSVSAHVPVALLVEPDSNYPSAPACFCLNLRDSFEYLKCFYESLPERNPLLSITATSVGMKIPVQTQALEMRIIPLASMLPICQTNFRCAMLDWLLTI